MWNPEICRYKTAVMWRIQHAVSRGYDRYVSGECRNDRVHALADKFSKLYRVDANNNQRCYAKTQGRANALLFLHPKPNSTDWLWWLLATNGTGLIAEREHLRPAMGERTRLCWLREYELVLLSRKGNSRPRVTWRMKRQLYNSWHARIRSAVRTRKTNAPSEQALHSLYRTPGFSGARLQVKKLSELFRREWNRTRKSSESMPPTRTPRYVRASSCPKIPLTQVVQRLQEGRCPFPRIRGNGACVGDDD